MKIKDFDTALQKFEEAAIKHEEATETGDYKTANKNYAVIVKAVLFLKEQNHVQLLSEFLTHHSDGVKTWAAAYLLSIEEEQAVRVLEQVTKGSGIRSLAAKTILSEWQKGNLKL